VQPHTQVRTTCRSNVKCEPQCFHPVEDIETGCNKQWRAAIIQWECTGKLQFRPLWQCISLKRGACFVRRTPKTFWLCTPSYCLFHTSLTHHTQHAPQTAAPCTVRLSNRQSFSFRSFRSDLPYALPPLHPPFLFSDWNGAGTRLVAGEAASEDAYWAFADATRKLGFHAMLTRHRWVSAAFFSDFYSTSHGNLQVTDPLAHSPGPGVSMFCTLST
jgi:hypothetical protein